MLDRQNWTQIQAALQLYYKSIAEIAMMIGDQQLLGVILKKALGASNEATKQFLESFEIPNIDRIIVTELDSLVDSNDRSIQGSQQLLGAGGNPGSQGNGGAQGMDALSQLFTSIAGGNPQ
jgi:hypothetical protein